MLIISQISFTECSFVVVELHCQCAPSLPEDLDSGCRSIHAYSCGGSKRMSESDLSAQQFLTGRQRNRPVILPEHPSGEELARNWTLTVHDLDGIASFTKQYRLVNAVQLRTVRLFGRFLRDPAQIPPKIVAYIATQLGQPTPLTVQVPMREATLLGQQKRILLI